MEKRKVIKNRESYYINIPSDLAKALGILKGDRLGIIPLPGSGFLTLKIEGAAEVSVNVQSYDRLQKAADSIYSDLQRRLKDLDQNFISNLHLRIVSDLVRSGLFDLKARVEKLETKPEVSDQKPGKVIPLNKKKRDAQ